MLPTSENQSGISHIAYLDAENVIIEMEYDFFQRLYFITHKQLQPMESSFLSSSIDAAVGSSFQHFFFTTRHDTNGEAKQGVSMMVRMLFNKFYKKEIIVQFQ